MVKSQGQKVRQFRKSKVNANISSSVNLKKPDFISHQETLIKKIINHSLTLHAQNCFEFHNVKFRSVHLYSIFTLLITHEMTYKLTTSEQH